ncbi:MAG: hypothetical protein K2N34_01505 [Lachnospiraceae bacterium]|nr:hypothetical protein [Lachnospiraceae bacterium]
MSVIEDGSALDGNPLLDIEWICKDENDEKVCNFIPRVLRAIEIKGSDGSRFLIGLKLCFANSESVEIEVPLSGLDKIEWPNIDSRCIINSHYRGAKGYLANIIRCKLDSVPVEVRFELDKTGIQHMGEETVFVAGDWVVTRSSGTGPIPNIKLKEPLFRLDIDEELASREVFEGMRELICLSPEIGRVLVAHVISGITRAAFKEAGFTPCAVLVVVGESGMLKSNYVPHLVQLYNRNDGIRAETRFNSTSRFIEDILYEYSECTAVIDDLHTAESRGIKRRNEETVEEIIRRISDDTGRGRKEGNTSVQKKFRGNVVFIGEYIVGKESTIPRALVVNLTKRPDGGTFDKYQRMYPLTVSTFYYFFIQWYVDHFQDICRAINTRLTKFRKKSIESDLHGRLCDTQFYMEISYMLFLQFCTDSGFISAEEAAQDYKSFDSQLIKLIREQQDRYRSRNEDLKQVDYLKLIRKLYKSDSFRLAKSKEQFKLDKHDGLYHYEECVCLRGESLDKKIRKIIPGSKREDVIKDLLDKNALKTVREKHSVQIDGLRFYAIKLEKLE